MILFKDLNTEFLTRVFYNTETRILIFQGVDDIYQGFRTVPMELYHALPVGQSSISFYLNKINGRFAKWALVPGEVDALLAASQLHDRIASKAARNTSRKRTALGLPDHDKLLKKYQKADAPGR